MANNTDPEATNPGLTKAEDGTIWIGPAAAKVSMDKAEKEALENAQAVITSINEEAASGRKPGAPAGDDTVGNTDNS